MYKFDEEYAKSKSIFLDYCSVHLDHLHALINLGKDQNIAQIMQLMKGEMQFQSRCINAGKGYCYEQSWLKPMAKKVLYIFPYQKIIPFCIFIAFFIDNCCKLL